MNSTYVDITAHLCSVCQLPVRSGEKRAYGILGKLLGRIFHWSCARCFHDWSRKPR